MHRTTRGPARDRKTKSRKAVYHVGDVVLRDIDSLIDSPENNTVYDPVNLALPANIALRDSIAEHGIQEPLAIDPIGYVASGHRRLACARAAGLRQVPCRVLPIYRADDLDHWRHLLTLFNEQRQKSFAEVMRESIVKTNRDDAYASLIEHRKQKSGLPDFADAITPSTVKKRKRISAAKFPMLNAIEKVIEDQRQFWPLSARRIHYVLCEQLRPLKHASKPDSTYINDDLSYNNLTDLLARARLAGIIPWSAVGDDTRPVVIWQAHRNTADFIRSQLDGFFTNYWRDLLQSQPHHIEIVAEKLTLESTVRPVAEKYCATYVIGRGFCSLSPRYEMLQRFRRSGRDKLVILILSDHDPAGMTIAESFARSMRDDFGLGDDEVLARKIALTPDQIAEHNLPHGQKATDKKASTRAEFIRRYGEYSYELEALSPEVLQKILHKSIDEILDVDAFNHELDRERDDAQHIDRTRQMVHAALAHLDLGGDE